MNILILAAGGNVVSPAHGNYPLWLADSNGETILERQIKSFAQLEGARFSFAFRQADARAFHLADMVGLMAPGCSVVEVVGDTAGAACTALLAVGGADPGEELIILSVTDMIDADMAQIVAGFRAKGADAGIVIFDSLHPRYSYVRCDAAGFVVEAAEKRPISRHASAGLYWFARAGDFFTAVKAMILKDAAVQGQFFICPSLNELVLRQMKIATHSIEIGQYHPIKAPQHVDAFEQSLELKADR